MSAPAVDSPTAAHNALLRAKGHHHAQTVCKEDPKLASSCQLCWSTLHSQRNMCQNWPATGTSKSWVRALQPQEWLQPQSYRSIRGIGANSVILYFRIYPLAPLGRLLPGPYAVLVKMMWCNQLLFPFTVKPRWFLSHTVGCTIKVPLTLGSDPGSSLLFAEGQTCFFNSAL